MSTFATIVTFSNDKRIRNVFVFIDPLKLRQVIFRWKKGFRLDCRERFEASSQNSIK